MEETRFVTFVKTDWNRYMEVGAAAWVVIANLILLYHEFKVLQIKDYKEKYDYVNLHEVRFFWYSVLCIVVAARTLGGFRSQPRTRSWFQQRL